MSAYFSQDVDVLINLAALLPNSWAQDIDYFVANAVAPSIVVCAHKQEFLSLFIYLVLMFSAIDGLVTIDSGYSPFLRQPSYLSSKIAGELLLFNAPRKSSLYIVRPSSVYGHGVRSGIFRYIYDSFLHLRPVTLANFGLWSADFIYAGDVAKSILSLLDNIKPGVFNLGTGSVSSIHEVSQLFSLLMGADERLIV